MDSDDESDNSGPDDRFFVDSDIPHITKTQIGLIERTMDDLFTGKSPRVTYWNNPYLPTVLVACFHISTHLYNVR